MQHIHIVRHGQSQANAAHIIAGQQESSLSKLGQAQAREAGKTATSHHFDTIVTSPMTRAIQTAEIIAGAIGYDKQKIMVIPELIERGLGDLEGKHYDETPYGSGNSAKTEDVPNIEPMELFFERTKEALQKIYELPGKNILVVCHNGTGRMLLTIHEGGQPMDMYEHPRMENALIYGLR